MKLSMTLVLATLAVAAFAPQATDAAHGRPVMKRVSGVATHHAKLAVPDLSEDDVMDEPIGHTFGIDDNEEPTTPPVVAPTHGGYVDSSSGSGEGDDDHGSNDGSNEDSSSDSSGDGSNAAPTTSTESADTHGAHPLSLHEETDWELFDHQDSTDGSDGSGENAESSSSGSNEDTDGSGGSGSNEEQPPNESAETSDHHHNAHGPAVGGAAGLKLAASAAAGSAHFSVSPEHLVKVAAGIGAAVGALVAAVGVVHLRRQQQRDEQSTLAEELPEPQTGREDFEPVSGADEDELASSSVDLEEALTQEQDDADDADDSDDESEGSFANDAVV